MSEFSPYSPPTANTDRLGQQVSHTPLIMLGVIALFSFLSGIGDGVLRDNSFYTLYNMSTILAYAILGVLWYRADAHKLGRSRSTAMIVGIVLFLALSIPVYLFRSRGAAKGAIATVLFILYLIACGFLSTLGEFSVVGFNNL